MTFSSSIIFQLTEPPCQGVQYTLANSFQHVKLCEWEMATTVDIDEPTCNSSHRSLFDWSHGHFNESRSRSQALVRAEFVRSTDAAE